MGLTDDVIAKASTRSGVRLEQAAEHANRRRFAAAVRAEKPADLAFGHLQVQIFDDFQVAEILAQANDVYDIRAHGALV